MSGYHRLAEYLVAQGVGRVATHQFPRRGTWRLAQPFVRRAGLRWYGPEAFLTELWAAATTLRGGVVHFLHGENAYRFAASVPGSRRLVATFHLPSSVFGDYVRPMGHLERLDAIVFVAGHQREILNRLAFRPASFVVPHGIDIEFYVPPSRLSADPTCLFVGQWLRDFATLEAVVADVRRAIPQVCFRLVLPASLAVCWRDQPGVDVLTGLDDRALRRCYQEAALLVMPLRDCTANNAVLEAMACGLPIVTTDVGGIRDYVDEGCARLLPPGKPAAMAEAVLELLGDPKRRAAMSRTGRTRAESFAWPLVAKQIAAVYEAVR